MIFFLIFSAVQGAFFSNFCLAASPSIRYSTFRNSISIKMVCGQTHPQNKRPNAAVNKTMKTIKVIIVTPKMKKSCGQNIFPKMINFASGILNRNKGLPFIFINGKRKEQGKETPAYPGADIIKSALWVFGQIPISFFLLHPL